MKPSPQRSAAELIEWVLSIILRETRSQLFGTITIHLQKGRIIRVSTERHEVPENSPSNAIDTPDH